MNNDEAYKVVQKKLEDVAAKNEELEAENIRLRTQVETLTDRNTKLEDEADKIKSIPRGLELAEKNIAEEQAKLDSKKKSLAITKEIRSVACYLDESEKQAINAVKDLWQRTKKKTSTNKKVKRTVNGKPADVFVTKNVSDISLVLALAALVADIRYNPETIPDWKSASEIAQEKKAKEEKAKAMRASRAKSN